MTDFNESDVFGFVQINCLSEKTVCSTRQFVQILVSVNTFIVDIGSFEVAAMLGWVSWISDGF